MIRVSFFLSNILFGLVIEMSQGDVSFTHPKHMFLIPFGLVKETPQGDVSFTHPKHILL